MQKDFCNHKDRSLPLQDKLYLLLGLFVCFGSVRDWSLIMGRGGYKTGGGGGHVKFYPYEKGGRKKF